MLLQTLHIQTHSSETLPDYLKDTMIANISLDSRTLGPNSVFFAIQGQKAFGHSFITQAIQNGAIVIYSDHPIQAQQYTVPCFFIPHLKEKIPDLARFFYGDPSKNLWLTAVTGTNGKSSIAYLLSDAQTLLKTSSYYIGTLGYGPVESLLPLNNTTPDVMSLNRIMAQAVQMGVQYLNFEASSHGLHQGRLEGIQVRNAIFTNLTHDHLDYHPSMEEYFQAKMKLFERPELENCILNLDNPYSQRIQQSLPSHVRCLTTSLKNQKAEAYGQVLALTAEGMQVDVQLLGHSQTLLLPMIAEFQLSNLLCVLTNLVTQGFHPLDCLNIAPKLRQVLGRMERWDLSNGATILIDYAHTPDALLHALQGLKTRYSKVICVFGCGGEKDREKRPTMAAIAEQLSDIIIVTSDNPRYEPFAQIVADMMPGFKTPETVMIEPDRRLAILKAIKHSNHQTVIILAGKGQETYMDIQGIKHPFDEREVLKEHLQVSQNNSRVGMK